MTRVVQWAMKTGRDLLIVPDGERLPAPGDDLVWQGMDDDGGRVQIRYRVEHRIGSVLVARVLSVE